MNVFKLKDIIIERLESEGNDFDFKFNRQDEALRVERKDNRKGVDIELAKAAQKAKNSEKFIDEIIYYIEETLNSMADEPVNLDQAMIYPVVRSTSFHRESKGGHAFMMDDHTNETRVYYAIDLKNTYRLIDEELAASFDMSHEDIRILAYNNLENLKIDYKKQTVQENDFYFINHNDGYDASRILNEKFLNEMYDGCEGEMMVGLPHQDVLIIADVKNQVGYDIMAQMMMQYFTEGLTPITSLSFSYKDKRLQPVFILGKQKNPKRGK
jgi:uncharacterized protein YtpQ (UPF0354 family)